MKKILYILVLAFISLDMSAKPLITLRKKSPLVGHYQDPIAVQEALALLIQKHGLQADTIAIELSERFRRDPKMQVAVARAYHRNREEGHARQYLAAAFRADSTYAPAYVLYGDIFGMAQPDSAAVWYDRAIMADSTYAEGYLRYADVMMRRNPEAAKQRLQQLHRVKPDFNADLYIAQVADDSGNATEATEYFEKAYETNPKEMSTKQLANFASDLYLKGNKDKALEVAQYGQSVSPRSATFNRLVFWISHDNKDWEAAIRNADLLFNQSDSVKLNEQDYVYRAEALQGAGRNDEALKEYEQYIASTEKPSVMAYSNLGKIYREYAKEDEARKDEFLQKADQMYAKIEDYDPGYSYYMRALVAKQKDAMKQGLSIPFYEKLLALPDVSKSRQAAAYEYYIMYYANIKGDMKTAKRYGQKLQQIDPDNDLVKQIMAVGK